MLGNAMVTMSPFLQPYFLNAAQRLHFVEKLTVGYIAPDKMQGGFFSVVFLAFKKMPVHFSFN